MRFWDTSAVVPLLTTEPASAHCTALLRDDKDIVVWWGTMVECSAALARRRRDGVLSNADEQSAIAVLDHLATSWRAVEPSRAVREAAIRLARVHPLRTADALQLAAAVVWRGGDSATAAALVTDDRRLAVAADLEGFRVVRVAES